MLDRPITIFLGAILPVGLVAYLLMRLARRYVPWLRGDGRRWIPALTLLIGVAVGAIPGLIESTLSVTSGSPQAVTWPAAMLYGALGGLMAPSLYEWIHRVILRDKRKDL